MEEWGYEEKYDLLGILIKPYTKKDYSHTVELTAGFVIDILKDGSIGAIEIIDWARSCGIRPHQVKDMDINVEINKKEYTVEVIVSGTYKGKIHKIKGVCYK